MMRSLFLNSKIVALGTVFSFAFLSGLADARAYSSSQQTYLDCLVDFEPYANANWHPATHNNALLIRDTSATARVMVTAAFEVLAALL
jgi:hypothetical protein